MAHLSVDDLRDSKYENFPIAVRTRSERIIGIFKGVVPGRDYGTRTQRMDKLTVVNGAFVCHVPIEDVCEIVVDKRRKKVAV